ncbi:4'-phosphopantetheinyl transferase family protein [Streptomyces sp. NPDC058371]|uniref:4'-phosphopantetheinyl transferase family protein n=1 Tax=Streptomyces sp. NPDC058371 TaxID=3346463 RepID=UPI00364B0651
MEETLPWVVRELPPPGSLDLWLLRVSDVPAGILDEAVLDATERQRAAALMHAADRTRFTAAHVALRRLLGTYLSLRPEEINFGRDTCPCCGGPHGRPTVLGAGRELFFSLSHRGDLALVGTAMAPIGVDVDLVSDQPATAELASMLHVDEQAELAALAPELRPRALARLWTRKEAYLKGLGTGLGRDPALDYVGSGRPQGPYPPSGWTLLDVPVDRGYAAAVAVRGELDVTVPTVSRLSGPDVVGHTPRLLGRDAVPHASWLSDRDLAGHTFEALQTERTPP